MAGGGNRATKGVKFHKGVARRVGGCVVRDAIMKMATRIPTVHQACNVAAFKLFIHHHNYTS